MRKEKFWVLCRKGRFAASVHRFSGHFCHPLQFWSYMRLYISLMLQLSINDAAFTELFIGPETLASVLNHIQGLCIYTISLNEISASCLTSSSIVLLSLTWLPVYTYTMRDVDLAFFWCILSVLAIPIWWRRRLALPDFLFKCCCPKLGFNFGIDSHTKMSIFTELYTYLGLVGLMGLKFDFTKNLGFIPHLPVFS